MWILGLQNSSPDLLMAEVLISVDVGCIERFHVDAIVNAANEGAKKRICLCCLWSGDGFRIAWNGSRWWFSMFLDIFTCSLVWGYVGWYQDSILWLHHCLRILGRLACILIFVVRWKIYLQCSNQHYTIMWSRDIKRCQFNMGRQDLHEQPPKFS